MFASCSLCWQDKTKLRNWRLSASQSSEGQGWGSRFDLHADAPAKPSSRSQGLMNARVFMNQLVGRWASRRAMRVSYKQRTLLIADHWDGSVQQFYHFMFGYLFPLSLWILSHRNQPIMVRDCGPMNVWFDALGETVDVEVVLPGSALHLLVGNRIDHAILKGLDNPNQFDRKKLLAGASAICELLSMRETENPPGRSTTEATVTIVDRQSSEGFYHLVDSETHMSGSERRSTPNIRKVDWAAFTGLNVQIVDLAQLCPQEQIGIVRESNVLVGQHGAGLLHMIWMKPGSKVVEIEPPLPKEVKGLFAGLAELLGHQYAVLPQESVHAQVDTEELSLLIQRMTEVA